MIKLYDVSIEKENLFKQIDIDDGEITLDVEKALVVIAEKEEQALIVTKQYVEQKKDLVKIAKDRVTYYSKIAKELQKRIDNTTAYMLEYMLSNEIACVSNGIESVSVVTNPPSVDVFDEGVVPESVVWHTVKMDKEQYDLLKLACGIANKDVPDSTPSIDKVKIHELHRLGVEVAGTQIIQKQRLKMR